MSALIAPGYAPGAVDSRSTTDVRPATSTDPGRPMTTSCEAGVASYAKAPPRVSEEPVDRISQGREVGHDAIIELRVDAAGDVWSGGRAVIAVDGTLAWD